MAVPLGANETAFVNTCAKYYRPVVIQRLQSFLRGGDSLQESFGKTLEEFGAKDVLPEKIASSFGLKKDAAPAAEPVAESKPVKVKAKKPAAKAKKKKK